MGNNEAKLIMPRETTKVVNWEQLSLSPVVGLSLTAGSGDHREWLLFPRLCRKNGGGFLIS
jgi:hypothetical protein